MAVKVKPAPTASIVRSANAATPLTAARVTVPPSVAPGDSVPLVTPSVTLAVEVVTVFPNESRTATRTDGAIAVNATTTEFGCATNARCVGAAACAATEQSTLGNPETVAVTRWVPAPVPNVQCVVA